MLDGDEKVCQALSSERYTSKIPLRIKSGCFRENCLFITTSQEERDIEWSSIQYICLGAIEEHLGAGDTPKSGMRNVIRKLFFGDKPQDDQAKPQKRTLYILDIYVKDHDAAFRFDSSSINYKSFFGEVSYISFHNFKRLLQELADRARDSYYNRSAVALLVKRNDKIHRHPSVYDFELECQHSRSNLKRETHWSELSDAGEHLFHYREKPDSTEESIVAERRFSVVEGVLHDAHSSLNGTEHETCIEEIEIIDEDMEEIEAAGDEGTPSPETGCQDGGDIDDKKE